jgi:hypothetical protein
VLNKLRNVSPVKYISLKVLSMKLAMIMCLVLAGCTQSLYLLTIKNMLKGTKCYSPTMPMADNAERAELILL